MTHSHVSGSILLDTYVNLPLGHAAVLTNKSKLHTDDLA